MPSQIPLTKRIELIKVFERFDVEELRSIAVSLHCKYWELTNSVLDWASGPVEFPVYVTGHGRNSWYEYIVGEL